MSIGPFSHSCAPNPSTGIDAGTVMVTALTPTSFTVFVGALACPYERRMLQMAVYPFGGGKELCLDGFLRYEPKMAR